MPFKKILLTVTTLLFSLFLLVPPANAITFPQFTFEFPTLPSLPTIPQPPTPQKTVIVSPSPTKTPTPTTTKTPTPTPTKTPTPTPTKTPPAAQPQGSSTHDQIQNFIMNAINDYRAKNGLSKVSTSQQTCDFAKTRAKEITTDFSHNGFRKRIDSKTLPYTSWTKITENIAMTSNYKDVVNMWIKSSGHAANMRADTPYVCVEFSGNYYAMEGMKP